MIKGFRIAHYTDLKNITGCTVILAPPDGAVGGVDVRGFAPGTRETELLGAGYLVERAHAIVLSGGSAFGLDAATGVTQYLAENNIGYDTGVARVPIVASAVLFDLGIGNPRVHPNAANAFEACLVARTDEIEEGSVGAGTGATVGKLLGMQNATKGGIGYSERVLQNGIKVSTLVAVNALGDVIDSATAQIVGGARGAATWADSSKLILNERETQEFLLQSTTIGVVMTDAALTVEQANIVAKMAQDGVARATRPSHTMYDGDVIFVLAAGTRGVDNLTMLGHASAVCVADAIVRGVKMAQPLGGVKTFDH